MADLTLKIRGEDHASPAFHSAGAGADHLKESVKELLVEFFALEKMKEVIVDFAKESVEAFASQEKAQRQLKSVAGELTEEIIKQSEVFERQYAVAAEVTEGMATMMLRFGATAESIKPTTQAILDYAAATGQDAESATQALMRAVERGSDGVRALGIHYTSTKDKTLDLALATEELTKKFGGAAETERGGLTGSLRAVSLAWEHVHESSGSFFGDLNSKTHILDLLATAVENVSDNIGHLKAALSGDLKGAFTKTDRERGIFGDLMAGLPPALANSGELSVVQVDTSKGPAAGGAGAGSRNLRDAFGQFDDYGAEGQERRERIDAERQKEIDDQAKQHQKIIDDTKKYYHELDDMEERASQLDSDRWAEQLATDNRLVHEAEQDRAAQAEKAQKEMSQYMLEQGREIQRQLEQEEANFKRIGLAMGMALLQGLDDAINNNGDSTTVVATKVAGGIISTILSVLADIYIGEGTGQLVGYLGSIGTKYAVSEEQKGEREAAAKKSAGLNKHDGGWIERFHSGGWPGGHGREEVGAVLQTGERVFSRAEVARNGGPAGVDRIAQGGGRANVNMTVQAFDSQSVRDYFGDKGGRGLLNAMRIGRGDAVPLLGRG